MMYHCASVYGVEERHVDMSEGTRTAEPERPATRSEDRSKTWFVKTSCAASAFGMTSVVSIAKFGVCSRNKSVWPCAASDRTDAPSRMRHLDPYTRCMPTLRNRPLRIERRRRLVQCRRHHWSLGVGVL
jgi:hypothetical protein